MKAKIAKNDKSYLAMNMSYLELKEYYLKVVGEKKFSKLDEIVKDNVVYPLLPTGALHDEDVLSFAQHVEMNG